MVNPPLPPGVAVGMINTSWGGTRIETWISREELVQHPWMRDEVARYEATLFGAGYWNRYDPFDPDAPAVLARTTSRTASGSAACFARRSRIGRMSS